MKARSLALLLVAALLAVPIVQAGQYDLKTSFSQRDAQSLLEAVLQNPQVKSAADDKVAAKGKIVLAVDITGGGGTHKFTYDGAVKSGGGKADYTVSGSRDTALGIVNSDDRVRMLTCFVKSGHISIKPASAGEQAAINAAKSQAARGVDCSFGEGSRVTFRGLVGAAAPHKDGLFKADLREDLDHLVLNKFGAPIGWYGKQTDRLAGDEQVNGIQSLNDQDIRALATKLLGEATPEQKAQFKGLLESDPWNGANADLVASLLALLAEADAEPAEGEAE